MKAYNLVKDIIAERGSIEEVYWVACGGSLIDLLPAHMLLERESCRLVSSAYTAREFCISAPKRLGEHSLVVACSHSGNTPEVLDACALALERGAKVVALTDNADSKIAHEPLVCWVYPWGTDVPAGEVPSGIAPLIAAELLEQQEGYEHLSDMYQGVGIMDNVLPAARRKVNEELAPQFAALCQEHPFLYILGSGPNFCQTYGFAICSLMEMQWQSCSYIHSGEYFHGPFEVTEPGVFYFLQMGSSEFRTMDERALAFLREHTDTLMVLDALEYGMDQVPESVRAYLDPVLFYAMNVELRAARGKVFGHDPDYRRYMGVVSY